MLLEYTVCQQICLVWILNGETKHVHKITKSSAKAITLKQTPSIHIPFLASCNLLITSFLYMLKSDRLILKINKIVFSPS